MAEPVFILVIVLGVATIALGIWVDRLEKKFIKLKNKVKRLTTLRP